MTKRRNPWDWGQNDDPPKDPIEQPARTGDETQSAQAAPGRVVHGDATIEGRTPDRELRQEDQDGIKEGDQDARRIEAERDEAKSNQPEGMAGAGGVVPEAAGDGDPHLAPVEVAQPEVAAEMTEKVGESDVHGIPEAAGDGDPVLAPDPLAEDGTASARSWDGYHTHADLDADVPKDFERPDNWDNMTIAEKQAALVDVEPVKPWDGTRTHADIDAVVPKDLQLPDDWEDMTIAEKKEWLDANAS
jgi:hypothetical protein